MKNKLKFVTVIIYAFLVLYVLNKLVEWGVMSKNYMYLLTVGLILFIGMFGILHLFERNAKGKK